MRVILYLVISIFFISCGDVNFAKRRYTKGVYVEKRSHGKTGKLNSKKNREEVSKKVNSKENKPIQTVQISNEIAQHEEAPQIKPQEIKKQNIALHDSDIGEEISYVQEEEQIGPPELEDGEILRKSNRKSDPLGKASGILGFTGLGLFLLTLLISFILFLVIYFGSLSPSLNGIIFNFMFYISMALGVAALITGAISFSKTRNRLALAGIIIGAIFATILFVALLVTFLA